MDEFVLQESTGYMLPALRFLAKFHTVISLVCLVGYYCLKVPLTVNVNFCASLRDVSRTVTSVSSEPSGSFGGL